MRRWIAFAHRHAAALLIALALLAAAGAHYGATHPPRLEFEDYLDHESEAYRLLTLFRRQVGKDMNLAVRLEGADPLDPALLAALGALEAELAKDPEVRGVESLLDLPLLDPASREVKLTKLSVRSRAELERIVELHPFLVPYYVEPKARALAFYVSLEGALDAPRDLAIVVDRVLARSRAFADQHRLTLVAGGFPYLHTRLQGLIDTSQARAQAALLIAHLIATLFLLNSWASRALVIGGSVALMMASFLVFPLATALGRPASPGLVSSMIPTLILIVAVSQLVQLSRVKAGDGEDEVAAAMARLARPLTLAAWTTAIGFFVLMTFPSRPMMEFGALAGVALLIEQGLVLALAPALLRWATPVPDAGHTAWFRELPERVHRHRWKIVPALAVALAVMAAGLPRLAVLYDPREAVSRRHPLHAEIGRAQELIGGNDVQVFVRRTDGKPLLAADSLRWLDQLETRLGRIAGVKLKVSMTDYFRTLNVALGGAPAIPSDADFPKAILAIPDSALLPFWLRQENLARVLVRLERTDTTTLARFETELARAVPAGPFRVDVSGSEALYYRLARTLPADLVRALAASLAALLATFWLAERSVVRSLLFMSPLIAALTFLYGTMGHLGIPLMVATAMIASVASGMVVDPAFYLAHGHRAGDDLGERYARFAPAAVQSGVLVAIGFLSLMLSDFLYIAYFGAFLGVALIAGLLLHLFFLPVVLLDGERPARLAATFAALFGPALIVLALAARGGS